MRRGGQFAFWSLVDALCARSADTETCARADGLGAIFAAQALVESADLAKVIERRRANWNACGMGCCSPCATRVPALDRSEAGRLLGQLGDHRIDVRDPLQIEWCKVPSGLFRMGEKKVRPTLATIIAFPATLSPTLSTAPLPMQGYAVARYWKEAERHGFWEAGRIKMWSDEEWRSHTAGTTAPFNLPNHPAVYVSWYEALAFGRWLNEGLHANEEAAAPERDTG